MTSRSLNVVVSERRCQAFSDILLASGWSLTPDGGYIPPEHICSIIERETGISRHSGSTWSLPNALSYQAQFDEAFARIAKAA